MLNNVHFVALHVLMGTISSFAISNQGRFIKFDAVLMVLICFCVCICSAPCLPLTLPGLNI